MDRTLVRWLKKPQVRSQSGPGGEGLGLAVYEYGDRFRVELDIVRAVTTYKNKVLWTIRLDRKTFSTVGAMIELDPETK